MITDDIENLYDILDISPQASSHEVREAYIRTKATFTKDSLALYTIISPEEREDVLKTIEEAYMILSNPEKRREYDKNFAFIHPSPNPFDAKVISIDRSSTSPPSTEKEPEESLQIIDDGFNETPPPIAEPSPSEPIPLPEAAPPKSKEANYLYEIRSTSTELDAALLHAIEIEEEWKGIFLRKVRDAYKISIEEMAGITKVTKTYLLAVEEENYKKLPAAVYVRGFVTQMAKVLRLPHEKVACAYLSRYNRNRTE